MNQHYEPVLKQEIIRLYLEEGRTMKSLTEEYNLGKGTLANNGTVAAALLRRQGDAPRGVPPRR